MVTNCVKAFTLQLYLTDSNANSYFLDEKINSWYYSIMIFAEVNGMKKKQKILIGVLIIVLIAVSVIIISVKTDDNKSQSDTADASTVFITDEAGNTIAVTQGFDNQQPSTDSNGNNVNIDNTEGNNPGNSINQNSKVPTTSTNTSPDNNSSTQKPADYNLESAELIQTQITSFGELKLYSLNSAGRSIYLFTIEKDGKRFYKEIPGSYIIENIYYANLDDKFGDEIIVHANKYIGNNPAKYENYVLKITTNGFEELFDPSTISLGFSGSLKDNFSVEITNSKTGMNKTVSLQNSPLAEKYWDSNGNVLSYNSKVKFEDSFYVFEPYDYDDDGLFEIGCNQYVTLTSQQDCIGYTRIIMDYDYTSGEVIILETYFNLIA